MVKLSAKELEERFKMMQLDEKMGNFLEEVNFQVAESIPWVEYKTLNSQIKKTELLYKTYILACAKNDKPLRVHTMEVFKEMLEALPKVLVKYRDHVKECLKDQEKEDKKCCDKE